MVTGQHAPQRGMLLSLACSSAWHAPQPGMFLSLACFPAWHAPQPGMLPNVVSSSPVRCGVAACGCVRSEDLKRIGHGVR